MHWPCRHINSWCVAETLDDISTNSETRRMNKHGRAVISIFIDLFLRLFIVTGLGENNFLQMATRTLWAVWYSGHLFAAALVPQHRCFFDTVWGADELYHDFNHQYGAAWNPETNQTEKLKMDFYAPPPAEVIEHQPVHMYCIPWTRKTKTKQKQDCAKQ